MDKLEMVQQEKILFPVAVYNLGVLFGKTIFQISSGCGHTCVIANDSNVYCWGFNG
jgi:alpha-tubulin suppressor-like RCC1 family protein